MSITFMACRLVGNRAEAIPGTPDLNVSSVNGRDLMAHLGLEWDDCGSADAADLVARCRRKLMHVVGEERLDAGIPATEERGLRGARIIDCGRPEGYLRDKTAALLGVALYAWEKGGRVTWA